MAVVSGSVTLNAGFTQVVSSGVVTTQNLAVSVPQNLTYANGTGAGQVDLIYAKQLSLAGSATTLDLTALTDLSGASINFARVRELIIQNLATTSTYTVTVGAAASNAWTGILGTTTSTLIIPPSAGNGLFRFSDYSSTGASTGAVVSGTSKSLKLDPGANTISINIVILGCSATS